jgi:hypothetical protein
VGAESRAKQRLELDGEGDLTWQKPTSVPVADSHMKPDSQANDVRAFRCRVARRFTESAALWAAAFDALLEGARCAGADPAGPGRREVTRPPHL